MLIVNITLTNDFLIFCLLFNCLKMEATGALVDPIQNQLGKLIADA